MSVAMYYLVKFEDGIYYICDKSRISIKNQFVSAKYTGGVWYSATIVASNSKKSALVKKKNKLEKEEQIQIDSDVETDTNRVESILETNTTEISSYSSVPEFDGTHIKELLLSENNNSYGTILQRASTEINTAISLNNYLIKSRDENITYLEFNKNDIDPDSKERGPIDVATVSECNGTHIEKPLLSEINSDGSILQRASTDINNIIILSNDLIRSRDDIITNLKCNQIDINPYIKESGPFLGATVLECNGTDIEKPPLSEDNSDGSILQRSSTDMNTAIIWGNDLIRSGDDNMTNLDLTENNIDPAIKESGPIVVATYENPFPTMLLPSSCHFEPDNPETNDLDSLDSNDANLSCGEILNRSAFFNEHEEFMLPDVPENDTGVEAEDRILPSEKLPKRGHKQHSCFFCGKVIFQLPRHWFKVHYKEPQVREIMALQEKNPLRKKKISYLRKKGDYKHNTKVSDSENIVMRNNQAPSTEYRPCPSCLGYFSKNNMRHHKKNCVPKLYDRCLQGNSIRLTNYIHARASDMLRNQIAPNMFKDEISNHFLFDEILIVYGNFLCIKYTESHLKTHIRAQLRLLGRFMMQVKKIDPNIKCSKDLMHPSYIDTIRKSIDIVAGLKPETGIYEHPTNARTLATEFKKVLDVVLSESDKNEDDYLRKSTKALIRRYNLELAPYINRICKLSENRMNRMKKVNGLPENKEIEIYLEYLISRVDIHLNKLKINYDFENWHKLCQYVLVALAVFNRKRPGETQRIELEDFNRRESVSRKDFINLNEKEKIQADKYSRVSFRGKLGNTTALLMNNNEILPGIEMVVKYRSKSGVHPENPYLFGFPSNDKYKTYDTYRCHRQFLEDSGLNGIPLTFTNLRKHFTTQVAKEGTSHEEELRISNYMSHKYNIHKTIYDQSTSLIDITTVSQRLERSSKNNTKPASGTAIPKKNIDKNFFGPTTAKNKENVEGEAMVEKKIRVSCMSEDDEYFPESNSEVDELDPELTKCYSGKFKRRKLWLSKEKQVTRTHFKNELLNDKFIDSAKIHELKTKHHDILQNRSIPMIKQWLNGERMRLKQKRDQVQGTRLRYSTPEREELEKSTEQHSLSGTEPSLEELNELVEGNDILKRRSADSLLRKFRYMQKKSLECTKA